MCIIAYKPAGVEWMDDKVIDACWQSNRDGAGFFIKAYGKVQYWKGYMKLAELKEGLETLKVAFPNIKDHEVGIHFRIATHGGTCPELTHPFPLSGDPAAMHHLYGKDSAIMHNGIIGKAIDYKDHSDTSSYILDFLYPISGKVKFNHPLVKETVNGSRLLITTSKSKTLLIGDWKDSTFGWKFSHGGYTATSFRGTGNFYGYQDWDEDCWELCNGEHGTYRRWKGGSKKTDKTEEKEHTPFAVISENLWYEWNKDKNAYIPTGKFLDKPCMDRCEKCQAPQCSNCAHMTNLKAAAYGDKYIYLLNKYPYQNNKLLAKVKTETNTETTADTDVKQTIVDPFLEQHRINQLNKEEESEQTTSMLGYVGKYDQESGCMIWTSSAEQKQYEEACAEDYAYKSYTWLWDISKHVQDYYDPEVLTKVYTDIDGNLYKYKSKPVRYIEISASDASYYIISDYDVEKMTSILVDDDKIIKWKETI